MHITFGIAWIGASFYFVFLENALNRTENIRDELAAISGPCMEVGSITWRNIRSRQRTIPKHLHWFKYEAYFTWVSGFGLLFIIYYFNASAMLIDPNVLKLSATQAISISIGSFIVAWVLYDFLLQISIEKNKWLFALVGIVC